MKKFYITAALFETKTSKKEFYSEMDDTIVASGVNAAKKIFRANVAAMYGNTMAVTFDSVQIERP